nr:MAG TPA: hypothetical protein [Caudoviricetes sp.]
MDFRRKFEIQLFVFICVWSLLSVNFHKTKTYRVPSKKQAL